MFLREAPRGKALSLAKAIQTQSRRRRESEANERGEGAHKNQTRGREESTGDLKSRASIGPYVSLTIRPFSFRFQG